MGVDSANSKVQEICDLLKKETLDPAKVEAARIVEEAEQKAQSMIEKGKAQLAKLEEEHQKKLDKQLEVHEMAIQLAIKQGLAQLKENVLALFTEEMQTQMGKSLDEKGAVTKIVEALITSLEKEGIDGDFSVSIPKHIEVSDLLNDLSDGVKNCIQQNKIEIGHGKSGIYVVMTEGKVGIEVSQDSMMALLSEYVGSELRKKIVKA